ncbi:MAG: SLBB domain-containing protein [Acidobacteriota bacterium]|nr:SLBB domain-containing protein [Acidobacteriota bacterium]
MKTILAIWLSGASLAFCQTTPAAPPPPAPASYVLQTGDDLEIRAYNIPELNTALRIRPDGRISLLLLDDVDAAGKTPEELGRILTAEYSKHFRNPKITVVVRSFAAQTVYVGGEVEKAGPLPLLNGLTAVQAVVGAGGLKESTSGDQVVVVHNSNTPNPTSETLDVNQVLAQKTPDRVLQPSDVVYVKKSYLNIYIGGEVAKPGLVPLSGGMTMLSAIIQAGGFKDTAKTDSVVLIRDSGHGTPVTSKVKVNDVFLASAHTRLKPFDVIFVPKTRIARMDKWVDQYIRQLSPAILSFGFSYLIGQGSLTPIF